MSISPTAIRRPRAQAQAAMKAKGYAADVIEMEVTELAAGRRRRGAGDGGKGPHRHPGLQRRHRAIRDRRRKTSPTSTG